MKRLWLSVVMLVILVVDCKAWVCHAENKNGLVWTIDSAIQIAPGLAASVNEVTKEIPDPVQYACVWVIGRMEIPDGVYVGINYGNIEWCCLPDGVIVENVPVVQDRNLSRTVENGVICEQIGIIVYIEKEYDIVERLNLIFAPQQLSLTLFDRKTNETIRVFPCVNSVDPDHCNETDESTGLFERIPFVDVSDRAGNAKTIIDAASIVSKDMAIQNGFDDLLRYIRDGYQCWVVRFRVLVDGEHLPLESFFVQTKDRESSFVLSKGEYFFLASFEQGDHIHDGYIDAFLITKSMIDENDIGTIEDMLIDDELTLYLAPTRILLSYGLWELNTPWIIGAPLTSNTGIRNAWRKDIAR
ncbi:MAG: hypothetical protein IKK08_02625 [Clostridia bacterium]|nr:hypothetical protein [Clostridia bacterium]